MKVTMKMALASEDDLTVAYDLLGLLDNIERGYYPADESDEDAPTFLDVDDLDHLRLVYDRLKAIIDRRGSGAFHRVFGGFSTVRYEKNQILDLTKDVVELHPRLLAALEAAEKLTQIRKTIAEYYAKEGDESGSHAAIHSTETELVNGLIVLIGHMSDLAVSAGADAERALERARLAESRLESATQPLDEQMARLNKRVIELNAENTALRAGLDPNDAGTGPILAAIAELKSQPGVDFRAAVRAMIAKIESGDWDDKAPEAVATGDALLDHLSTVITELHCELDDAMEGPGTVAPAAAPEGFALVPLQPTQTMCQAGQAKAREWPRFPLRIAPIWQAMIAAAEPAAAAGAESKPAHWEAPFTGHCGASRDGECSKTWCPQNRDGEPAKSGRSCPLPDHEED